MADGSAAAPPADALATALTQCLQGRVTRAQPLFTALSGGPDSSALALLAADFAARHGYRHTALIIDHGIRPDSADEARRVRRRMQDRGIDAEILTVNAAAPTAGLQAWARAARYALLLTRARQDGGCLLFGHHADDQAETVMMRLQRGSGLAGLAGMRPAVTRAGVDVLRPLLGIDRSRLVAHCRAQGLVTEQDPSNADRRFERVRTRATLAAMGEEAMSPRLGRLAAAAAAIDDSLLAVFARDGLLAPPQASGHMPVPDRLHDLPAVVRNRALAHIIQLIGAPDHPPTTRSLTRLAARLAAGRAATVGGVRFARHQGGWLAVAEAGRRPPRHPVAAGTRVVFNRVWEIESPVAATVRHLGDAGSGAGRGWSGTPGWCALPPLVRQALPVLETLDGSVIYPHLIERWPDSAVGPTAAMRFLGIGPRPGLSTSRRNRR